MGCNAPKKDDYFTTKGNIELEKSFDKLAKKARLEFELSFSLDSITKFDWDSVLIITPYIPIKYTKFDTKVDLYKLRHTKVTSSEGTNVLAFVKKGEIVDFLELESKYGLFKSYNAIRYYTPSTSNFLIVKKENTYIDRLNSLKIKPISDDKATFIEPLKSSSGTLVLLEKYSKQNRRD